MKKYSMPVLTPIKAGSNQFALSYVFDHKRYRISSGRKLGVPELKPNQVQDEAESKRQWGTLKDLLEEFLKEGINPLSKDRELTNRQDHRSVIDVFKLMLQKKSAAPLARTSLNDIRRRGANFLDYLSKEPKYKMMGIEGFSRVHAEAFLLDVSEGKSNRTFNNMKRTISSIFKVGVDEGVIERNPFAGIKDKALDQKESKFFTQDQMSSLLIKMKQRDYIGLFIAAKLSYDFLIDNKELLTLKRGHFSKDLSVLRLPRYHNKKTDNTVNMQVSESLQQEFSDLNLLEMSNESHLIGFETNARNPQYLNSSWQKLRKYGGAKEILHEGQSFSTFRDTAVHEMVQSGMDISQLHLRLRNYSYRTTDGYLDRLGLEAQYP